MGYRAFFLSSLLASSLLSNAGREEAIAAYDAGHYADAVKLLVPLAESGDVAAQVRLGALYELGNGVAQDDAKAVFWYAKAADQGEANAQNHLGLLYLNGRGVTADTQQAFGLIKKAAEQGNPEALTHLAEMYFGGLGVQSRPGTAFGLLMLGITRGDKSGLHMIRKMQGLTPDQIEESNQFKGWTPGKPLPLPIEQVSEAK